jgi:hypothetical protein
VFVFLKLPSTREMHMKLSFGGFGTGATTLKWGVRVGGWVLGKVLSTKRSASPATSSSTAAV